MNVAELLGVSTATTKNNDSIANKVAFKAEMKKIDSEVDRIVSELLSFIGSESDFINRGMSFGDAVPKISEEEKKELESKLKSTVQQLPSKISMAISGLFDNKEEECPECHKSPCECDKEDNDKPKIAVAITPEKENYFGGDYFGY